MAEYQRGSGPKQLPQGAATAANNATPNPAEQMDIPVQYATPEDHVRSLIRDHRARGEPVRFVHIRDVREAYEHRTHAGEGAA